VASVHTFCNRLRSREPAFTKVEIIMLLLAPLGCERSAGWGAGLAELLHVSA